MPRAPQPVWCLRPEPMSVYAPGVPSLLASGSEMRYDRTKIEVTLGGEWTVEVRAKEWVRPGTVVTLEVGNYRRPDVPARTYDLLVVDPRG